MESGVDEEELDAAARRGIVRAAPRAARRGEARERLGEPEENRNARAALPAAVEPS